jgi:hypothetical protein
MRVLSKMEVVGSVPCSLPSQRTVIELTYDQDDDTELLFSQEDTPLPNDDLSSIGEMPYRGQAHLCRGIVDSGLAPRGAAVTEAFSRSRKQQRGYPEDTRAGRRFFLTPLDRDAAWARSHPDALCNSYPNAIRMLSERRANAGCSSGLWRNASRSGVAGNVGDSALHGAMFSRHVLTPVLGDAAMRRRDAPLAPRSSPVRTACARVARPVRCLHNLVIRDGTRPRTFDGNFGRAQR